jgi:Skp family chaperone for outer membrane proteins
MNFSLATLVPDEDEVLRDEIARTEAELEAVSNKLKRLIQLRQLSDDTKAAREVLDKLASQAATQKRCHEQIFASIEVLKGRLAEADEKQVKS